MYLTIDDFCQITGKTVVDDATFTRHEYRLRKLVDNLTFSRLKGETNVRESVRHLMAEMMLEALAQDDYEKAGGSKYSSMNNDGVSVSFSGRSTAEYNTKLYALVHQYLTDECTADGVPLLFRGAYP